MKKGNKSNMFSNVLLLLESKRRKFGVGGVGGVGGGVEC